VLNLDIVPQQCLANSFTLLGLDHSPFRADLVMG
jgi:hypothetical protein